MLRRASRSGRDPPSTAIARSRMPEHLTLWSNDLRVDLRVDPPRVAMSEEGGRTRYVGRYQTRGRVSWTDAPDREIRVADMDPFIERASPPPPSLPKDVAESVAASMLEELLIHNAPKYASHLEVDRHSGEVTVSWREPPRANPLAPGRMPPRLPGAAPPPQVLMRIRLLLRQADSTTNAFEAAAAVDKARELMSAYAVSDELARALVSASRRQLGGASEGPALPSGRPAPKRLRDRVAVERRRRLPEPAHRR